MASCLGAGSYVALASVAKNHTAPIVIRRHSVAIGRRAINERGDIECVTRRLHLRFIDPDIWRKIIGQTCVQEALEPFMHLALRFFTHARFCRL